MSTTKRRPAARRGQGDKLREEILEVAAHQLEESGDARTMSLRAIAREVGVAATSIYLHFDSLETLTRALKEAKYAEFRESLLQSLDAAPDDPRARLRTLARAYVEFALERPGTYKVLFSTTLNLSPRVGQEPLGEDAFQLAVDAVTDARGTDRDAHLVATQLWCLMHGLVTLRADRPNFPWSDLDEQLDDLVRRIVDV